MENGFKMRDIDDLMEELTFREMEFQEQQRKIKREMEAELGVEVLL